MPTSPEPVKTPRRLEPPSPSRAPGQLSYTPEPVQKPSKLASLSAPPRKRQLLLPVPSTRQTRHKSEATEFFHPRGTIDVDVAAK
eukprot:2586859-Amphidinium_carterae.1